GVLAAPVRGGGFAADLTSFGPHCRRREREGSIGSRGLSDRFLRYLSCDLGVVTADLRPRHDLSVNTTRRRSALPVRCPADLYARISFSSPGQPQLLCYSLDIRHVFSLRAAGPASHTASMA